MQKTIRNNRISAPKALLGILLAIVILAIAQSLAFSISEIFLNAGLPGAICNILAGIYMWCWRSWAWICSAKNI